MNTLSKFNILIPGRFSHNSAHPILLSLCLKHCIQLYVQRSPDGTEGVSAWRIFTPQWCEFRKRGQDGATPHPSKVAPGGGTAFRPHPRYRLAHRIASRSRGCLLLLEPHRLLSERRLNAGCGDEAELSHRGRGSALRRRATGGPRAAVTGTEKPGARHRSPLLPEPLRRAGEVPAARQPLCRPEPRCPAPRPASPGPR